MWLERDAAPYWHTWLQKLGSLQESGRKTIGNAGDTNAVALGTSGGRHVRWLTGGNTKPMRLEIMGKDRNEQDLEAFKELFVQTKGDNPALAALWFSQNGDLELYFAGYRKAIDILANYIRMTGGDNTMVYPLIFLIRHTIELGLKESIVRYHTLEKRSIKNLKRLWNTHDFAWLADQLEEVSEGENSVTEDPSWKQHKEFLINLQNADPSGSFAKYARQTDGSPFRVMGNIYAGRILEKGTELIDFLEGTLTMLNEYNSIQSEVDSEMGDR